MHEKLIFSQSEASNFLQCLIGQINSNRKLVRLPCDFSFCSPWFSTFSICSRIYVKKDSISVGNIGAEVGFLLNGNYAVDGMWNRKS